MLEEIYRKLGLTSDLEKERQKFINRMVILLDKLEELLIKQYEIGYEKFKNIVEDISFQIGEPPPSFTLIDFELSSSGEEKIGAFSSLIKKKEFKEVCLVLTILLKTLKSEKLEKARKFLSLAIKNSLKLSLVNLGVIFNGEIFMESAATELDKELLLTPLNWLKGYPDSYKKFSNALYYYLNKKYQDALTNAYSALEGIVKIFLNTKARLDNKKTLSSLVKKLQLPSEWSQILYFYCKTAHEYSSRHGKKKQASEPRLTSELTEFYVYLTGAALKLILQRMRS